MKNANTSAFDFLPYEEELHSDLRYENDDDNPNLTQIEEEYPKDDYNFYPDSGF